MKRRQDLLSPSRNTCPNRGKAAGGAEEEHVTTCVPAEAMLAVYAGCSTPHNTRKKRPRKSGKGRAFVFNPCSTSFSPSHGREPPGFNTCSQPSLGENISDWSQHGEPVFGGLGRACDFDVEAKCFGRESLNWVVLKIREQ